MNFSKRQNEFCDIPGFGASKGERIVKALQKLWQKIQYLEKCRISEKKSTPEASCTSKDEDLTVTDVQYQLLLLQLKYVRSLLRKNFHSNTEVSEQRKSKDEREPAIDRNITKEDELYKVIANKSASAGIYTWDNSIAELNSAKESSSVEDISKNVQVTPDNLFPKFRRPNEESTEVHQKTIPSSSKPHYHLKLDDVPFILGASATASHSVVANVQNIIARMKLHNKALCGSKANAANTYSTDFNEKNSADGKQKPNVRKSTFANAHSIDCIETNFVGENSEDVTKMMNDLTRDLCALAMKQQKLVESIDASQIKYAPEINSARNTRISHKHVENDGSRTHQSHSESEVKLHAEVKKVSKVKKKDFIKHNVPPTQSACSIGSQASNLSIMDRRKLLRSLQKFKKHLSEEDISWE